jgi:ketosteroid isomerase-like protein
METPETVLETVRVANAEFYDAIEACAMDRMEAVWSHDDNVRCVHPGWGLLVGWERVRESWERVFEGEPQMRVTPTGVYAFANGDLAWVTCVENISVFQDGSFDSVQAAATNLFIRRDARWLMVHHHASPIPIIVPQTAVSDTIQ